MTLVMFHPERNKMLIWVGEWIIEPGRPERFGHLEDLLEEGWEVVGTL